MHDRRQTVISKLLAILKGEPVALTGLVTALITVLAAFGVDKAVVTALGGLVTALIVLARSLVTPVDKAKAVATQAAVTAATHAVSTLGPATVGEIGTIPATAIDVIDGATSAAQTVISGVLGGK
jgi:hypothetical protein